MPSSLPLVQLQLIQPLVNALRDRGIDPETVLESVGLTLSAVKQPGSTVHVMVIHQFLENCAIAARDKCFCAEVGSSLDTTGWPMIQQAMAEAKTLGDFLSIYVSKATQVASSVTAYLDVRGETASFGETRRFKPLIVPAQNDGFMICLMISLIEHVLGRPLDRRHVTLVVSDPEVVPKRMTDFTILKGNEMGAKIQFPSDWLRTSIQAQVPTEQSINKSISLNKADFLTSFRSILRQQVAMGGINSEEAARQLHMNSRTLARRLSAFGTTSSKEISSAKIEYAKHALKNSDRSIEQISLDLGYSDPSNFTRAFCKETGETPSDFRSRERAVSEQ